VAVARTRTQAYAYNCSDRPAEWKQNSTDGRRAWCCAHKGLGCPVASEKELRKRYSCHTGLKRWGKRHWCCEHQQIGCPLTLGDCKALVSNPATSFNASGRRMRMEQRQRCCKHRGIACPSHVVTYKQQKFNQQAPDVSHRAGDADLPEWAVPFAAGSLGLTVAALAVLRGRSWVRAGYRTHAGWRYEPLEGQEGLE